MSLRCVLVTGAGGFIGGHVVRDQLARGYRVRALDINGSPLEQLQAACGADLEILIGDVADAQTRRRAVAGVDVVMHLASAHLEKGLPDEAYERINVIAVEALLQASVDAGVQRFIQVSSCGVHGSLAQSPGNEESPFCPDVAYERTKLAGEQAARQFWRKTGFSVVVVRPVWVYGPGCPRTEQLFDLLSARRFLMIGRGVNLRASIYIADFLDVMERCAATADIGGEVFIATHSEQVTVRQIVAEISRFVGARRRPVRIPIWLGWVLAATVELAFGLIGKTPPITRRSLKFFTNDAGFSGSKAEAMLGFRPGHDLAAGLSVTHEWWRTRQAGAPKPAAPGDKQGATADHG